MVAIARAGNQLDSFTSALLDSMEDGVVVLDLEFRYLLMNRAMERIVGLRPADALGQSALELFPQIREFGIDVLIRRAMAGETVATAPLAIQLPGVPETWVINRFTPMRNYHGVCVGVVGIVEDVTERHQAEAELRQSERWFRALTENNQDMVSVLNPDGSTKYLSPSLERFLGLTPAEAGTACVFTAVHPDDIDFVRHEFARSREQLGRPLQVQFRYRRADGSWRTLLAIARNLLDDPVVRGIVVNSRDITEQRELEFQLQHSQKLDAIGRMAGAVAHDFNNLLTVIQGNAGLALAELATAQPGREELEEIEAAAERASALTRQLLTFSRQQPLELQELPVNGVIDGMQRLLTRAVAADQRLELALHAEAGAVRVDRGQLEQVLMNLVVNARDAMPSGGTVTLSTRNEELRPEVARFHPNVAPGAFVVVAVADTGVGMSADVKSRIFEPFFTTKEPGKGTGLGLPTVYGIVQQSGGFVAVHSAPGQGSTFEIFLPRA